MNKNLIVVLLAVVVVLGAFAVIKNPFASSVSETNDAVSSEKLDMNAVCEGALAYMSFPDAAAAEVFVEECKVGKHPQVIEEYKAQMNISEDAAI